mgnify:CR=1 FL=1
MDTFFALYSRFKGRKVFTFVNRKKGGEGMMMENDL